MKRSETTVRIFGVASGLAGLVTLVGARRVAVAAAGDAGSVPDPRIVAVLGGRQLAQGVVTAVRPTSAVLAAGSAADVAHALSMLPLTVLLGGRFRRPALLSAAAASSSAVIAARLAS